MNWYYFDALAIGLTLVLAGCLTVGVVEAAITDSPVVAFTFPYGEQLAEAILFPIWLTMGVITLVRLLRRR